MRAGEVLRVLYNVDKTAPILIDDCGCRTYIKKVLISPELSRVTIIYDADESKTLTTKELIAELEKIPKTYIVDAHDRYGSYSVYAVTIEEKDYTERIILYV